MWIDGNFLFTGSPFSFVVLHLDFILFEGRFIEYYRFIRLIVHNKKETFVEEILWDDWYNPYICNMYGSDVLIEI